ncbi:hypothetical protein BAME_06950 [Bacillus sp. M 2-6]|nr:hypothetical protein BAME_06950 [Bacillus sp. M 2-6]
MSKPWGECVRIDLFQNKTPSFFILLLSYGQRGKGCLPNLYKEEEKRKR